MSLRDLEQKDILTNWQNREELSFPKKISLALTAFVLSTNLALAEPNKTIWIVNFIEWGTAELYKDKNWNFEIRNWNAKNGSDFIYGTTIIDGKKYIVYSAWIEYDIDVFLESDWDLYKEYVAKYWIKKASKFLKEREQYLENFLKDNPVSNFKSETERLEKSLEWWEFVLERINKI